MTAATHIQVYDPADLFEEVAPHIRKRLPLGNLHWKSPSPTRPLRAIENLDVALDREDGQPLQRHQIPGLRQTPFVKLLLVRCDDKEQYKEKVRKETKDWVKTLGLSTSGKTTTKGQERHDAYEYVIVHVVVPGTTAATQPKSSKHFSIDATDSTDSVNSKSKWTGKSTSTVFDKLRADFASSSKAPFERVAQVRLVDPAKPSNALGPLEIEEQWSDLIDKLKSAILLSFDARVAQYEEDIREKEGQRSLPGWNFCTFFILKEGLARGFENVGLLEDALQIYEELDAELDVVVQDQAKDDYNDAANALLPFAADLKDVIRSVLQSKSDLETTPDHVQTLQEWIDLEQPTFPWRLDRRDYQQMILTNQISALDFRVYIFIRQTNIRIRRAAVLAKSRLSKSQTQEISDQAWDADLLADIGRRSVVFLNLTARNLRQDLYAAWGGQELPDEELVIGNLIASWKWTCLLQTLHDCQIVRCFLELTSGSGADNMVHDMDAEGLRSNQIFANLRVARGDKANLIFQAGEMFTMLRTSLLQLCRHNNLLVHLSNATFATIPAVSSKAPWAGIQAPSLSGALSNETAALQAYRLLTLCACQCYVAAEKGRTERQLLFDLARIDAHDGHFDAALTWLDSYDLLESPAQNASEYSMLELYANCLRKAGRGQDLIRALLLLVRSAATTNKDHQHSQEKWREVRSLCSKLQPLSVPLDDIFKVQKLDGHVVSRSEGRISIGLRLTSLISVKEFGSASVVLRCSSDGMAVPAEVQFVCDSDLRAENGEIALALSTSTLTQGWYEPKVLEVHFNELAMHLDLTQQNSMGEGQHMSRLIQIPRKIYVFPNDHAPCVTVSHSPTVNLSQKRYINLSIAWGRQQTQNVQVKLRPATAGVRLDLMSAKALEGPSFTTSAQAESVSMMYGAIQTDENSVIQVAYGLDDPGTVSIAVRVEIHFDTTHDTLQFFDIVNCMVLLPVSVNVQDIHQANADYARFTIGPSRLVPINVIQSQIQDSSSNIVRPTPFDNSLQAFPRQPVSWTTVIGEDIIDLAHQGTLSLHVTYQCLDEVILESVLKDFAFSLRKAHGAFLRPCLAHLREQIVKLWTEGDIELATLTDEVHLWTFEELDWQGLLHGFEKSERLRLESWLRSWHETKTIPLSHNLAPIRKLSLKIPPVQEKPVLTAEITTATTMVAGVPTLATLTASVKDSTSDIAIEVLGSDLWLVGGQRKMTLPPVTIAQEARKNASTIDTDTKSDQPRTQTLVLVPQTNGSLVLPTIEVRASVEVELDNPSCATTVLVRNGIGASTFGIEEDDRAEKGHWLLETTVR